MKKQTLLSEKNRRQILLCLEKHDLKFVELKKTLSCDSNILAYNIKILVSHGLIKKDGLKFGLTQIAEHMMPYVHKDYDASEIPLPVVATIVLYKDKVLIRKKHSAPHKGKNIFIGGKISVGENIIECAIRKVKEKTGIKIREPKIICINNYITKNSHYIVFFIRAKGSGIPINAKWIPIKDIDFDMFPDNKYIIKNMLNNKQIKVMHSSYDEDTKEFYLVNIS